MPFRILIVDDVTIRRLLRRIREERPGWGGAAKQPMATMPLPRGSNLRLI
jgi:hypothetical protein